MFCFVFLGWAERASDSVQADAQLTDWFGKWLKSYELEQACVRIYVMQIYMYIDTPEYVYTYTHMITSRSSGYVYTYR